MFARLLALLLVLGACVRGPVAPPPLSQHTAPDGPAVVILLNPDLPPEYQRSILMAIDWWGKVVDRAPEAIQTPPNVFMAWLAWGPGIGFDDRITIATYGAPDSPRAAATYSWRPGRKDGRLTFRPGLGYPGLVRIARHELGHVLGLADNPDGPTDLLMHNTPKGRGSKLLPAELAHLRRMWGTPGG